MAPVLVLAVAALAPTINMSSSCHGQEKGLPKDQRASTYNICMNAEQGAQAELNKRWSSFPASARRPCAALAHTFESYIEVLVCIEIRAGSGLASLPAK